MMYRPALAIVSLLAFAACSSAGGAAPRPDRSKDGDAPDETTPGGSFGDETPAPSTSPDGQVNEVWSHSVDTLYRLDPVTKKVTIVAKFDGCDGDVIDIALDADSNLFATSEDPGGAAGKLWRVDRKTGKCTRIASGIYPNSLSFVPKGTVDPNEDALVGFQENNDYVRIDTKTGKVSVIGSLGNNGFSSSGDIVSVKGGPTYLTVVGEGCSDCLVEVNPKTGALVKNWGSIGHEHVFGIAFWAGSVYGFDNAGQLFEVTFGGGKLTTKEIPIPDRQAGLQFGGAGSTTSAPVSPTR